MSITQTHTHTHRVAYVGELQVCGGNAGALRRAVLGYCMPTSDRNWTKGKQCDNISWGALCALVCSADDDIHQSECAL
jgi:hypothetical protein